MTEESEISKKLNWKRIIVPVLLGLAAATYLLVSNLNETKFVIAEDALGQYEWVDANQNGVVDSNDPEEFQKSEDGNYIKQTAKDLLMKFQWTWMSTVWLAVALLMVALRDLGYIFRLRLLTEGKIGWRAGFDSIMLWEFSSALTPSVVGGSGIAIFILNREGINLGKSTATVFITSMMDELFYIIMVPLVFLVVGTDALFPEVWAGSDFLGTNSVQALFFIGYGFIMFLTLLITLSIFKFPHQFKRILMRIFTMRLLKRWLRNVVKLGDEIIVSSIEFKGKPLKFWAKPFAATLLSWTARFFTLNFIMLSFVYSIDHLLVYGRQLVMWVIMLISPTPGSSGVAEIALDSFFKDMIPIALIPVIAIIWRLLTYFPYLFVGAVILPRWLKRTGRESRIRSWRRKGRLKL